MFCCVPLPWRHRDMLALLGGVVTMVARQQRLTKRTTIQFSWGTWYTTKKIWYATAHDT